MVSHVASEHADTGKAGASVLLQQWAQQYWQAHSAELLARHALNGRFVNQAQCAQCIAQLESRAVTSDPPIDAKLVRKLLDAQYAAHVLAEAGQWQPSAEHLDVLRLAFCNKKTVSNAAINSTILPALQQCQGGAEGVTAMNVKAWFAQEAAHARAAKADAKAEGGSAKQSKAWYKEKGQQRAAGAEFLRAAGAELARVLQQTYNGDVMAYTTALECILEEVEAHGKALKELALHVLSAMDKDVMHRLNLTVGKVKKPLRERVYQEVTMRRAVMSVCSAVPPAVPPPDVQ